MIFEKLAALLSESKTLATITFQNYFRLYDKLSGMTGTALTEEEEFGTIYSLDIVEMTMAVEEEFGLEDMDEEDLSGISTVADLVRYLKSKLED